MKKYLAVSLVLLLVLQLFACSQSAPSGSGAPGTSELTGLSVFPDEIEFSKYREYDITPPDMKGEIYNAYLGEDGYIAVLTGYPNNDVNLPQSWHYYTTDDNGANWTTHNMAWSEEYLYPFYYEQAAMDAIDTYMLHALPLENGALLANMVHVETSTDFFMKVLPDGSLKPLELSDDLPENLPNKYIEEYWGNGLLLARQYDVDFVDNRQTYTKIQFLLHNLNTGALVATFESPNPSGYENYFIRYAYDGILYLIPDFDPGQAAAIDLESGAVLEPSAAPEPLGMQKIFDKGLFSEGLSYHLITDAAGNFYSFSRQGVTQYNPETDESANLMGAAGFTFQSSLDTLVDIRVENEKDFTIVTSRVGGGKVLRYVYDENKTDTRGKTLNIFTLRQNETLKLAAQIFELRNPDTNVIVETYFDKYGAHGGVLNPNGEDLEVNNNMAQGGPIPATLIDDAAKDLITRVLAGKGPDLIVLDDLPYASYARQGMFEDIAGIALESGVTPSIISSLEASGVLPYIPALVTVPVLLEDLAGSRPQSFDALIDAALSYPGYENMVYDEAQLTYAPREPQDRPQVYFQNVSELAALMLKANLPAVLENGTRVNTQSLKTLLETVGRLNEHYGLQSEREPEFLGAYSVPYLGRTAPYHTPQGATVMGMSGANQFWGELDTFYLLSLVKNSRPFLPTTTEDGLQSFYRPGFYGSALPGMGATVFTPVNLMGVSALGANKEDARAFIRLALSDEMQNVDLLEGLPVTVPGQKIVYDMTMLHHSRFQFSKDEDVHFDYEALFAQLAYPYAYYPVLEEAFIAQAEAYCAGSATLDEALTQIERQVDIYLNERL